MRSNSAKAYAVLAVIAAAFFSCRITRAQSSSCTQPTAWISVTGRDWQPIPSLHGEDFVGSFHGKPVRLVDAPIASQKQSIVVVLDASGSMGQAGEKRSAWLLGLSLATDIAEAKLPDTELALIIFSDRIVEQLDFSNGAEKIASRLRQIGSDQQFVKTEVKGRTSLWDAVSTGLNLVDNSGGTGIIYAITDGFDNQSRLKEKDIRRHMAKHGTRFFLSQIKPVSYGQRVPEEIGWPDAVQLVSDTGGVMFGPVGNTPSGPAFLGEAVDPQRKISMKAALRNFYGNMSSGYRFKLEFSRPQTDWEQWKLDLAKNSRSAHQEYKLAFSKDLPPCGGAHD